VPPIVYRTTHRITFSELDPYRHLNAGRYATHFADHRMQGMREQLGWGVAALEEMPFMLYLRRIEIDFLRPAEGDHEIVITSFVREFHGPNAFVECAMADLDGHELSRCRMTVTYVDRATRRGADWPAELRCLFVRS
jgi:acyl-CoA thioester hydrolase